MREIKGIFDGKYGWKIASAKEISTEKDRQICLRGTMIYFKVINNYIIIRIILNMYPTVSPGIQPNAPAPAQGLC